MADESESVGKVSLELHLNTNSLLPETESAGEQVKQEIEDAFAEASGQATESMRKVSDEINKTVNSSSESAGQASESIRRIGDEFKKTGDSATSSAKKFTDGMSQQTAEEQKSEAAMKGTSSATKERVRFIQKLIEELKKLKKVEGETTEEEKRKMSIADIKAGIDMVTGAVRTAISTVKNLTSAYQTQIEVESKLGATMRNSTGATDEQIQSVKDLASSLQGLGVVGDEVQLAGAQELATYVESAESIKTMLPVLDDMIAQQYGYNATAESSVTIATMLGKVLQGQTGALSRYGYSFTEAQEQLLKYGTEEQRVATLAEVVSESVGGVNAALASTPTGKMKQLSNDFGDLQETLGNLITNAFFPAVQWLDEIVNRLNIMLSALNDCVKLMFGIETEQVDNTGIMQITSDADDASDSVDGTTESIKELKKTLAGFDQLNILSSSTDSAKTNTTNTINNTGSLSGSINDVAENSAMSKWDEEKKKWEQFKKYWASGWESIKSGWNKFKGYWLSGWGSIKEFCKIAWNNVKIGWNSFKKYWSSGWQSIKSGWNWFWGMWSDGWGIIGDKCQIIWGQAQLAGEAFKYYWSNGWECIISGWNRFWGSWKKGWGIIGDKCKLIWDGAKKTWDEFKNYWQSGWNTITKGWNSFWSNWQSGFNTITAKISLDWSNVKNQWDQFKYYFTSGWECIKNGWNEFWGYWSSGWGSIGESIGNGLNSVGGFLSNGWNNITNSFSGNNNSRSTSSGSGVPHLATGGIVKAPTLALVGDNKGADHDPEVVSPLSKLQSMMNSGNPEIISLLLKIITLLENEEGTYQNIIYLDSEVIDRKLVKVRKRKNRRYGGATS